MKVGTDGVLLGAWAKVEGAKRILDIGTGTGLIALMAAQRNSQAQVDAVEINAEAYAEALENVEQSPWRERIKLFHTSIKQFTPTEKYDCIICNPPFFVKSTHTPDAGRNKARHCDEWLHTDLLCFAEQMLAQEGRLNIILPVSETEQLLVSRSTDRLFLRKSIGVRPTPEKVVKRYLLEFRVQPGEVERKELTIELERHLYSTEYIELTRDFYLNM